MSAPDSPSADRRKADNDGLKTLFSEFCHLADQLDMPFAERIGISGLSAADWDRLCAGAGDLPAPLRASCLRRLTYSVPLLHKLVTHRAGAGPLPNGLPAVAGPIQAG